MGMEQCLIGGLPARREREWPRHLCPLHFRNFLGNISQIFQNLER